MLSCNLPYKKNVLPVLEGVLLNAAAAGIKYPNRNDVALLLFQESACAAGVFTRSLCPSAPVEYCRQILQKHKARAVLINSGNANAFTGAAGREAVKNCVKDLSKKLKIPEDEIYIASTGVIGENLEENKILSVLDSLIANARPQYWEKAAQAIMTTDHYIKMAERKISFEGNEVQINAIAKGAGMIAPDMATMLCFIVTDAPIEAKCLQEMLHEAVEQSFNSITVDSDTSTSDSVLLFATHKAKNVVEIKSKEEKLAKIFQQELNALLLELALMIVRDGEGAEHVMCVEVCGAKSKSDAKKIAFSIANSPLVKTAINGGDANWGRVVMAVGKAGVPAERDFLSIWFGPHVAAYKGKRAKDYDEEKLSQYMKNQEIVINVDLGLGKESAKVFGCDLSKEYVVINSAYRS